MLGGGEYSFFDLITRLSRHFRLLAVAPEEGELAHKLRDAGIETVFSALSSLKPWHLFQILANLDEYLFICRKRKADLIYANGSRAAFYGGIIGRILHIPVLWHCRIISPDVYLDPLLIRLCRLIVANSLATAKRFRSVESRKIRVVYNGIDLPWFQASQTVKPSFIKENWKVMLLVARVSKMKRHDLAIAAFEACAERNADYHLFCIGDPDPYDSAWRSKLKKITSYSRVADRIHWINQVDDLRPWYQHADLVILPSDHESFGRVLVEAMACGVPVVAAKVGGILEIVRDGQDGFLFKPGDADELARSMATIMETESLRLALGLSAKNRAGAFSLDRHVDQMVRIFEEMIDA